MDLKYNDFRVCVLRSNLCMLQVSDLEEQLRLIDYKNNETIMSFFYWCLDYAKHTEQRPMNIFKFMFPDVYHRIMSTLSKRSELKKNIEFMMVVSGGLVYFGDLTFDNEHISREEEDLRRKAIRYLNKYCKLWTMVEEHGEQNGRYHIHWIAVFKDKKTPKMLQEEWPCFAHYSRVKSVHGTAKYLCNYVSKQVPRIRRNKDLVQCMKLYKDVKHLDYLQLTCIADKKYCDVLKIIDGDVSGLPF